MVDDDVASGLQPHLRPQRLIELLLDAELLEDGRLFGVKLDAAHQFGLEAADEVHHLAVLFLVIHPDGGVVVAEVVAQDALDQVEVAVQQGRRLALFRAGADLVPSAAEELDVAADFLVGRVFGGRANNEPAGIRALRFRHQAAQARAVFR